MVYKIGWRNRVGGYNTPRVGDVQPDDLFQGRRTGPSTPPVTDQLEAHYAARLESFADGDAVGTLTDQQNANDLSQATSSKKPTYRDNATDNIGGWPVVEFDGTDDLLVGSNFLSSTSGEIIVVMRAVSVATFDVAGGSADEATDNTYYLLPFNIRDDAGGNPSWTISQRSNDAVDRIIGDDASAGVVMWNARSSGAAYNIRIDGTDQSLTVDLGSDSGDWFGDTANRDNVTLGGWKDDTENSHMSIEVAEVLMYEKELTSTERSDIENWLNNTVGYGIF